MAWSGQAVAAVAGRRLSEGLGVAGPWLNAGSCGADRPDLRFLAGSSQ
jgi:hypothetical protein